LPLTQSVSSSSAPGSGVRRSEDGVRRRWLRRGRGKKGRESGDGRDGREEAGGQDRSVPQVPRDDSRWTFATREQVGGGVEVPTAAFWTSGLVGEAHRGAVIVQGDAVPRTKL